MKKIAMEKIIICQSKEFFYSHTKMEDTKVVNFDDMIATVNASLVKSKGRGKAKKAADPESEDGTKFRFSAERLMLTYKTHIDKEGLFHFVNSQWPVLRAMIVHEVGTSDDDHPYPHTHALFQFSGQRKSTTKVRKFDWPVKGGESIHPNWSIGKYSIVNTKAFVVRQNYLLKDDPSPFYYGDWDKIDVSIVERIHECKDVTEAITKFGNGGVCGMPSLQYTNQVIQVFNLKKEEQVDCPIDKYYTWQVEALQTITRNDATYKRKIHWYYDKTGNTGKTLFGKHLMSKSKGVYVMKQFGGISHTATIIQGAMKEGWDGSILIVDLPRDAESHQIYEPLEAIIDGIITSTKYVGKTTISKSPHLLVFANWLPDIRRMSLDRWVLKRIDPILGCVREPRDDSKSTQITQGGLCADLGIDLEGYDEVLVTKVPNDECVDGRKGFYRDFGVSAITLKEWQTLYEDSTEMPNSNTIRK